MLANRARRAFSNGRGSPLRRSRKSSFSRRSERPSRTCSTGVFSQSVPVRRPAGAIRRTSGRALPGWERRDRLAQSPGELASRSRSRRAVGEATTRVRSRRVQQWRAIAKPSSTSSSAGAKSPGGRGKALGSRPLRRADPAGRTARWQWSRPIAGAASGGDDRNRTGVDGFAGVRTVK